MFLYSNYQIFVIVITTLCENIRLLQVYIRSSIKKLEKRLLIICYSEELFIRTTEVQVFAHPPSFDPSVRPSVRLILTITDILL